MDLDKLIELEKAATPRPWTRDDAVSSGLWRVYGPQDAILFDEPHASSDSGSWSIADSTEADLNLLCALRNAAPDLFAEIARLREENQRLRNLFADREDG